MFWWAGVFANLLLYVAHVIDFVRLDSNRGWCCKLNLSYPYLGFPTEFCYEQVSRNRDETNFVITQNKVVILWNSMLRRLAYFVLRNGREQNKITQKRQNYAKKRNYAKK